MPEAGLYLAMSHPIVIAVVAGGLIAMSRIGYSRRHEMICFGVSYLAYSLAMVLQVWPPALPRPLNVGLSAVIYLAAVLMFCAALASISDKSYPWRAALVLVVVAICLRVYFAYSGASSLYVTATLHMAASLLFLHVVWLSRRLRAGFWADRLLWYSLLLFALTMLPRLMWVIDYKGNEYGVDLSTYWVVTQITFTVFLSVVAMSLMMSVMHRRLLLERELSEIDFLTGLHNRRGLSIKVGERLKGVQYYSLIVIDMDFFKRINDTHGHAMGDQVLVQAADVIRATVRESDLLARVGGEEFVVVMPGTGISDAQTIAHSLQLAFEQTPFGSSRIRITCTVSMGLACFKGDVLLRQGLPFVDELLFEAKQAGRNQVIVHPGVVTDLTRMSTPGSGSSPTFST